MSKIELTDEMMRSLRGRLGLDDLDDTSQDFKILTMDPMKIMRELAGWKFGDPQLADDFRGWFENVGLLEVKP
ncbi:hypothetical protein LCGC14_2288390 [marine sediment metagenome]|uniref:Uncharacterized protein n=1 Tax=marine sediment metagenome TaxID=412755 RepID=A0A0F9DEJ1_9ZZZZ